MFSNDKRGVTAVQAAIVVVIVVVASVGIGYYFLKDDGDKNEGNDIGLGTVLKYSISKEDTAETSSGWLSFEAIGQNSSSLFYNEDYRITYSSLDELEEYTWVDMIDGKGIQMMDLSNYVLSGSKNIDTIDGNVTVDVYVMERGGGALSTCYIGEYKGFEIMYALYHEYPNATSEYVLTEHSLKMQQSYTESENIGQSFTYSLDGSYIGEDVTGTCTRTCIGDGLDGNMVFSMEFDKPYYTDVYCTLCDSNEVPVNFIDTEIKKEIETIDGNLMMEIWSGECPIDMGPYEDLMMDYEWYVNNGIPYLIKMSSYDIFFTLTLTGYSL